MRMDCHGMRSDEEVGNSSQTKGARVRQHQVRWQGRLPRPLTPVLGRVRPVQQHRQDQMNQLRIWRRRVNHSRSRGPFASSIVAIFSQGVVQVKEMKISVIRDKEEATRGEGQ